MAKSSGTFYFDEDMVRISKRLNMFKLAVRNAEVESAHWFFFTALKVADSHRYQAEKKAIRRSCLFFIVRVACTDIELGNVRLVNAIIFIIHSMLTERAPVNLGTLSVIISRMCKSPKSCLITEIATRSGSRELILDIKRPEIIGSVMLVHTEVLLNVMIAHHPEKYTRLFNLILSLQTMSPDFQPILRYGLALCHCLQKPDHEAYTELYDYIETEMKKPVLVIASEVSGCEEFIPKIENPPKLKLHDILNINPKTMILGNTKSTH